LPNWPAVHAATEPWLVTVGGGPVSLAVTVLLIVADLQTKTNGEKDYPKHLRTALADKAP